ncbi:putative small secreted protein [Undibacterium sp. GrIS 1.8]|uniref:hypothetical protein n=1 Tax=Undibacterium sp. GrIS 1.8 TaxID=3143934 RepID=UPI003394655D
MIFKKIITSVSVSSLMLLGSANAKSELSDQRLTFKGLGIIHIGMTETELMDGGFELKEQLGDYSECFEQPLKSNENVLIMFERKRISRIEILSPKIKTNKGIEVGHTESQVKDIYGSQVQIEPHKYDDNGHYMIVKSKNEKSAIVMETDGRRITIIRTGRLPSVQYIEGCL